MSRSHLVRLEQMKMKMKRVASDLRVRAACLLFQEFSSFLHNLRFKMDREAVFKVAACMKIKPESALRYMREGGKWSRSTLETESPTPSEVVKNIDIVPPKIRAVVTLKEVGRMTWKEISKLLHISIPATKKRWSRWNKLKSQLKSV